MVHSAAELSLFLKARRGSLTPEEVGLPDGINRRRVRGLRREEVAQLAGVSVDYYTRIEQGRSGAVSDEVLQALARALVLSADERRYLHNLAGNITRRSARAARATEPCTPPETPRQTVRPELRALLRSMAGTPAAVFGRGLDILAWNPVMGRLWPGLDDLPEAELNLPRLLFTDPAAAALHADADLLRGEVVARLRADTGRDPEEPRLCAVVTDLQRSSALFRELWETHRVEEAPHGAHRLRHPQAGELTLHFEKLPLPADPGQFLLVYAPEPGSPSEERLALLAAGQPA
ncbi:helix-turn-helix domain-containing protein [Nocardiopsis composta]|uniref:Transcriptional regulator with XRE-family HTH domain n=1 Tax=Nocardiopsis composta TaxID=157465 RepID=A0A7W8VFS2_9ACTN|nr:helix-turn-helix transcriptional regulator [Nocardiopsis composta]MBB5434712.1 transcriptional regulator with XRE-family HTH domain [Nocardiopsis composta]